MYRFVLVLSVVLVAFVFSDAKAEKILPPPTTAFPTAEAPSLCEAGQCAKRLGSKNPVRKLSLGIIKRGHSVARKMNVRSRCR
jgi:hypothetical protein